MKINKLKASEVFFIDNAIDRLLEPNKEVQNKLDSIEIKITKFYKEDEKRISKNKDFETDIDYNEFQEFSKEMLEQMVPNNVFNRGQRKLVYKILKRE